MLKNLLVILSGAAITLVILGFVSGIIPTWIKDHYPTKIVETPTPSTTPTPTPTTTPKPSLEPEPSYKPTTKGGLSLGQSTAAPVVNTNSYTYATVTYEFKESGSETWQLRASYDTRYENYIDFDAVASSYDRKVTVCLYSSKGLVKCESGKVDPGTYTYNYYVGGKKLVYEIIGDSHGPSMSFAGPWKNNQGQTCVRVYDIKDDLTPTDKLIQSERMDSGDWREVHSEYCISGNTSDTHKYQVRVKDSSGNETTSTFSFPIL